MTSRLELPRCLLCEEALESDPTEAPPAGGMHSWCLALHTGGHSYGYCPCTDYQGLGMRDAARVMVGVMRADNAMAAAEGADDRAVGVSFDWDAVDGW